MYAFELHHAKSVADAAVAQAPSVRRVVVVRRAGDRHADIRTFAAIGDVGAKFVERAAITWIRPRSR